MFGFQNHEKIIHDLIILPQTKDLREGDFSLTLTEQNRPSVSISLSIRSPAPASLLEAAAPAREGSDQPTESPPAAIRTYYTNPFFLEQCYTYLYQGWPTYERQFLLSGIPRGENAYDLDILIPIKLFNASVNGVEADLSDLFATLYKLDKTYGLLLLGIIHSHLWKGRSAVHPSGTDRTLQKNLEESGYQTVQGIFSQDGFCGFFTNTVPFTLQIAGKGFEEVETHATQTVVRLNHIPQLSDQTVQAETSTGAPLHRPTDAYAKL